MAQITGGSSGGGSGAFLPTGPEGAVLTIQSGSVVATDAGDLKANSGEFTDGVNAASLTSDSVTVSGNGSTAQLLAGSLTMSEVEITKDHLAGIEAANPSISNPVVTANQIPDSSPAFVQPQGVLCTWPGYQEITDSAAVQLNSTTSLARFQWTQRTHYVGLFPPFSFDVSAVGTAGDLTWTLYAESDSGTLTSLDSATSTISSTGNVRESGFSVSVSLVRGRLYSLVASVASGADLSLSCNRNNPSVTSSLPDNVNCYTSADTGATWSPLLKDSYYPTVLNITLNSTVGHQPYLHYGRYNGAYAPCLNAAGTVWFLGVIPESGINLDVSGLTVDTLTSVFFKEGSTPGTVAIEASQSVTSWTQKSGRQHAGTNGEKLYLGDIAPMTLGNSLLGPVDTMQNRRIANLFNPQVKTFGKLEPYITLTSYDNLNGTWNKFGNSDAFTCSFVLSQDQTVTAFTSPFIDATGPYYYYTKVQIWFGLTAPPESDWRGQDQELSYVKQGFSGPRTFTTQKRLSKGLHYMIPWQYRTLLHCGFAMDSGISTSSTCNLTSTIWS